MSKLARLRRRLAEAGWWATVGWAVRWLYWNGHVYVLRLHLFPIYLKQLRPAIQLVRQRALPDLYRDAIALRQPYEPKVRAVMERFVKRGWTCVDLGANIGQSALMLGRLVGPSGRVVAFEAFPHNAKRLRRNMALSGFIRRVQIENVAVSDGRCERVTIFPGRNRDASEWNIVGHDVTGRRTAPEMEAPATSLDKYFPPGSRVHFMKIDIEGAEAQALAGMRRLLSEARPVIVIEFHSDEGWTSRKELYAAGYALFDLQGRPLAAEAKRVYQCLALPPGGSF